MEFGFGVVGCGMIASFHARAIAELKKARLVACFDTVRPAADRLAASTGCQAYCDLDEMLADPRVDIVTIGTPSGAHMEPAVAAARAGKHVIVEKPLEITLKRCDAIIEACQRAKVQLGTVFPSRFHESSRELKRALEEGRFGRVTLGDAYVKWFRPQSGKKRGRKGVREEKVSGTDLERKGGANCSQPCCATSEMTIASATLWTYSRPRDSAYERGKRDRSDIGKIGSIVYVFFMPRIE